MLASMSTIDVQGLYLVHSGDSLAFTDEVAFDFIADPSGQPSRLVIRGAVSADFTDADPDGDTFAVLGDASQGRPGSRWARAGCCR